MTLVVWKFQNPGCVEIPGSWLCGNTRITAVWISYSTNLIESENIHWSNSLRRNDANVGHRLLVNKRAKSKTEVLCDLRHLVRYKQSSNKFIFTTIQLINQGVYLCSPSKYQSSTCCMVDQKRSCYITCKFDRKINNISGKIQY